GVTSVHCEVARSVAGEYRDLHLFPTAPPAGVRFYSGILGRAYEVDRDSAADSIVGQAVAPFDYTRVIRAAWDDGIRTFIELGPGATCARMIGQILDGRPHRALAIAARGQNEVLNILRALAFLRASGRAVDLAPLYPAAAALNPWAGHAMISISTSKPEIRLPLPAVKTAAEEAAAQGDPAIRQILSALRRVEDAKAESHAAFLKVANGITTTLATAYALQRDLRGNSEVATTPENTKVQLSPVPQPAEPRRDVLFNRAQCLEFARGSVGRMLGEDYAAIDAHPTRVRLPDEPLMLVDRILALEGEPHSLGSGRVVTEHDVRAGAWYLDHNRIPTCITVEAGQADLFLSAWLGIDARTQGHAVYRLLDAEITLHGPLPQPGQTIVYDIHIDRFFRQGETWLFRFHFDGTVAGKPLITMRSGCAGFFSTAELAAGRGIMLTSLERQPQQGKRPADWRQLASVRRGRYDDAQIAALRRVDLAGCFGESFASLALHRPSGLPGGRMTLVHRVLDLDPEGGRYGLGLIAGEADIRPDDWFLTCHFVDDQVMPGTLMYECCLHTLRIFLMRLGWVGEAEDVAYEPVPGVGSRLKCRGQVLPGTRAVQYAIALKEYGYDTTGTPYAIADALMSADGRPIVQMSDMSLRLSGLYRDKIEALWRKASGESERVQTNARTVLFDHASIREFAIGKPSVAFGDRYRVFDDKRVIARLPGPPFQFLDRIVAIKDCRPWELRHGGEIVAEYDVPPEAWYFHEARRPGMPFAVLLEVALQPCGWLAAYLGSALTSEVDLCFRNLGGGARQLLPIGPDTGTLSTRIRITRASASGGMLIQNYDFEVSGPRGMVYQGDTYFGFFSREAL
ncbi:MAG TPA: type I polyketide synthase, partial [Gammaproteobacteria bacterium]|nr:type I polyketide synthase [Gammaproteobacteria bacterium]